MLIMVTFAVEAEFAPWRKLRKFRRVADAQFASALGRAGDCEIVVLLTGIGAASAEAAIARAGFSALGKPDFVISSGFAGALREQFAPGAVLAAAKTRTLLNHAQANSDPRLREQAIRLGAIAIENLITVERSARTAEEKQRLAVFGEAVDMESAIVLSRFASVPVVALRVVSDRAKEDLPIDFDLCLTPQGAIKPISLVNQIIRRPENLLNLVRFGRQSYRAANKLAEFLEKFVPSIKTAPERLARV